MDIKHYLKQMVEKDASDLYFKVPNPPTLRINDRLVALGEERLKPQDTEEILDGFLTDEQKKLFKQEHELDGAYGVSGLGRFRFNVYVQRGAVSVTFRSIKMNIPTFTELNLPIDVMDKLASQPRGLILITGHAGSGKSTTIASMIEYINQNFTKHIITIEDPIEFVFSDKKSVISQREVGADTKSFENALRHIIRQSPDIIFIGEMRDAVSMQTAIMAAETGHLVLSTLHTVDAVQTVDRIVNFFSPHVHNQIRMQLSMLLKGVVSMRLIPKTDLTGRVPACEVMLSTPTIRKMISEGRTDKLTSVIEEGKLFGMKTFNQALIEWVNKGMITKETALNYASNPDELALILQDILPSRSK